MILKRSILLLTLTILLSGCGAGGVFQAATATPPATSTPQPSATPVPPTATAAPSPTAAVDATPSAELELGGGRSLVTRESERTDSTVNMTIHLAIPQVAGQLTPADEVFNTIVQHQAEARVKEFLQGLNGETVTTPAGVPGMIDMRYEVALRGSDLLSLLFTVEYYTGGAHPGSFHWPMTYDFRTSSEVSFTDLFQPDAAYLNQLAERCISELNGRADLLFPEYASQGAAPLPDNYRVWAFTPAGLEIVYEEYQVAAYAAGPQRVILPYDRLTDLLKGEWLRRVWPHAGISS